MVALKRLFQITGIFSLTFIVALVIVACGSSSSTGSSSSSATTPTTAPTSSTAIVKTASATVKGKTETILTNAQGMTLYYLTADTATKVACTGKCAGVWPPLLFTGTGSPTSATSLPGTLSVVSDANGRQVEYNGHPLYTYSKDTAPGQTNGEGFLGKWFVATPTLAVQGTATSGGY
jgi:predicted lipoprotein with Yx(FWY)xxD motif